MLSYTIRRVAATIPVAGIVAILVFSLLYIAPGDPALIIAGDRATPEEVEAIRASLGLDRPFLVRFSEWGGNVLYGDLGTSIFTGQPVATMIAQRIGPTVSLLVMTLVIAISIGIPLGVLAAWKHRSWIDQGVMVVAVLGFSIPGFVVGYVLAYIFGLTLRWLPVQGYTPISEGFIPFLRQMIMPSMTLGLAYITLIARITRTSTLDVLSQNYIRTAKAKGLGNWAILYIHSLKNAAVPILTIIGIGVGALIGGAVVIESVFSLPGIGRLTVDAILRRDYPIIQGVVLFFSFTCIAVYLIVDLLYAVFDPRIRY